MVSDAWDRSAASHDTTDSSSFGSNLLRTFCFVLSSPFPEFSPWGGHFGRNRRGDEVLPCGLTRSQVRCLEGRELTPEDHEILLMLDSALAKKPVLRENQASAVLADAPFAKHQRCSICLETISSRRSGARLKACGHVFHRKCVTQWLTTGKHTCPLCATVVGHH